MDDFYQGRIGFSEVIPLRKPTKYLTAALSALAMAVLILDTKTAMASAADAVNMCITALIPSLFPFFIISTMMTSALLSFRLPFLSPLGKLLGVPKGAEGIILMGLLGGYPSGAQSVSQAYKGGYLSAKDAERMLAFCSNAGSAFLFGIGARVFPEMWICWLLWGIHMLSAWIVGILTPGHSHTEVTLSRKQEVSLTQALRGAVETMALVCGWVILFRVILGFAQRWFLWWFPKEIQVLLSGILEIANGCCSLQDISNLGLRISLCSVFLGFGGLCVALQTKAVTTGINSRLYLPGKIAQAAVSFLLCIPAQLLLEPDDRMQISPWSVAVPILLCLGYRTFSMKRRNTTGQSIPVFV